MAQKTYEGSCHCGKVKYRAELELEGGITCNHGKGKDGTTTYSVNLRCLEGVDAGSLKTTEFDGKKL